MITQLVTATIAGSDDTVHVQFEYRKLDPYAITMRFLLSKPIEWVFARDLLAHGLIGEDGRGDVYVCEHPADPDRTLIRLSNPNGEVVLRFERGDLGDFLADTYDAVEPETEAHRYTDAWFNRELKRLLTTEAQR